MKKIAIILFLFILCGCNANISNAKHFNEFVESGKGMIYYDENGNKIYNNWKLISGNWYYFDNKGIMKKNSWIDGYYVDENGIMIKSNNDVLFPYKVNGKTYYFNSNGNSITQEEYDKAIEDAKPSIGYISDGKFRFNILNKQGFTFESGNDTYSYQRSKVYAFPESETIYLYLYVKRETNNGNTMATPYIDVRLTGIKNNGSKEIIKSTSAHTNGALMVGETGEMKIYFKMPVDGQAWYFYTNYEVIFY